MRRDCSVLTLVTVGLPVLQTLCAACPPLTNCEMTEWIDNKFDRSVVQCSLCWVGTQLARSLHIPV